MSDTKPSSIDWKDVVVGVLIVGATIALLPLVWHALHLHVPADLVAPMGDWRQVWMAVTSTVITLLFATLAVQFLTRGVLFNLVGQLSTVIVVGLLLYASVVGALIVFGTAEERAVLAQSLVNGWVKRFFV